MIPETVDLEALKSSLLDEANYLPKPRQVWWFRRIRVDVAQPTVNRRRDWRVNERAVILAVAHGQVTFTLSDATVPYRALDKRWRRWLLQGTVVRRK